MWTPTGRQNHGWWARAWCGAFALALGACSVPEPTLLSTPSVAPVFARVIDEAIEAGASESQIALLEDAAAQGELTFEHLRAAVDATYACLEENGVSHGGEQVVTSASGITSISYTMSQAPGLSLEESVAISDDCAREHSDFVQQLNSTQPTAVALSDAYMRDVVVPGLTACFDEYGVDYDPGATPGEIWDRGFNVVLEGGDTEPGDPSAAGCVLGALDRFGNF